jgi:hypothetical protein
VRVLDGEGTQALAREYVEAADSAVLLVWREAVAAELRTTFRPYAQWLCRYAPRWVDRVTVMWDANAGSGCALSVQVYRAYNRVTLNIGPGWLDSDVTMRNEDIAHELVHVYAAPVHQLVQHLRGHEWLNDATLRDLRNQQYELADEQMTVDMARLLVRHLPPPVVP